MSDTCKAVDCDNELTERQRLYCSHRCKQKVKYEVSRGRQCKACHGTMKPKPALGGFDPYCDRKRCIARRTK